MAKSKKPYVMRKTIWNSVGGALSNPGESKVCRVGKYKVLVTRSPRLNQNGNPVHTATVINKNGILGASYCSSGSATYTVSKCLKRNGVDTKYAKR